MKAVEGGRALQEVLPSQIPYDRARAATARRMTLSVTTKPRVTLHSAADCTRLSGMLQDLRRRHSDRLTVTHLLARVTAYALHTNPAVNGWVQDDVIAVSPTVNLGIAVQTDRALVTPVLIKADALTFAEFVSRIDDLVGRARIGKLHPRELSNGTFTLTNLGGSRIGHFTPIINPPQLAILGVGRACTVPRWDGAAWQPVSEVPLSLTFDHAALDGRPCGVFLDSLIDAIEDPPSTAWR